MTGRVVTVFGGSGSIGRQLVALLADQGARVRVAVRDTEKAHFLKPLGQLGQIAPISASVSDAASVKRAVEGADQVVNLVGILAESGRRTFQAVHVDGAATVARASAEAGVDALIHMSALGADEASDANYSKTKALGEKAVREAFPAATILRPSVVFGPDDGFFNLFAGLQRLSPVLPYFTRDGFRRGGSGVCGIDLAGSGGPKFQPVYVGDVARAMIAILDTPALRGKTYELGGPRVYSMKEIMDLVVAVTRRRTLVVPLPFWVARLQGRLLEKLPNPPLTSDQVRLMEVDNVCSGALPGLGDLGIEPEAAEAILPTYLSRFRGLDRHMILRGDGRPPKV
ncbi:complex I NDUFA9 subunit family protein [Rhodospirillum rubrum]|uniref:3-beta-hydroxy-delta(5)-steroid dehydrogenase n=1 Tax=Rhodospirillum rubrum (strain ATCC 11170 / ATH 1.1.1 / DSM 467 / LMG 4362 / NCIMB 8255 / S1) TaxID=269796 RepID=Q2RYH4_RHORT|nr:complex I NDUFA9 subunit family protein [Rhodospirillum rubrum]ABC20821.1 3-beta-hydroxy-delta(5)-steroid dehydrogenase [Rhodospirillum rubrum ATCC 11170]AEO46488.1 3-beta-hydroxy-delta(5)-steroid dehydrogenase [Rhodospirillum rubrum F11]MBK5956344.1 complex I NDUFA9 subunit family protein [Rhodospirillum rubrum]QXG80526.1 complex I NDUFA9 subunit family protein [Rhodospirillum rubrum]HAQ00902.1 complex I NDUFA9 subunit family protein [Rhodospirillum rubrum]